MKKRYMVLMFLIGLLFKFSAIIAVSPENELYKILFFIGSGFDIIGLYMFFRREKEVEKK